MIDIKELRKVIADCYWPTSPVAINEILDRLEAAERERDWHAERCEDAMNECAALRAKIEAMERQEPAGWQRLHKDGSSTEDIVDSPNVFIYQRPLYALPGAKGE